MVWWSTARCAVQRRVQRRNQRSWTFNRPALRDSARYTGGDGAARRPCHLRFKVPMHVLRIIETPHEPPSERGCIEDQPQRVATFGAAAVGAPLPCTQPRPVCASGDFEE